MLGAIMAVGAGLLLAVTSSAAILGSGGGSPTISSDKGDYAPGATVTLTGSSWQPGEAVHISVNDSVGQTWSYRADVTADSGGGFTNSFQLPSSFIASYLVTATGPLSGTATTTFTDSAIQLVNWKTSPGGDWITGTLEAINSDYEEGDTVPFRIEFGTNLQTSGNPHTAAICRDYQLGNGVFGYTMLRPFDTSRSASHDPIDSSSAAGAGGWPAGTFQGVNMNITGVTETGGEGNCGSPTQRETLVTFNVISDTAETYLFWGGRLASPTDNGVGFGNSASFWNGGSLQMRLEQPDKTGGINPAAVIQLAAITVTKVVDSGSATPDQWCFNISPNPNNVTLPLCPASGQDSVQFIGLDTGSYTITETSLADYSFASGSGTNCSFSGSTATASVTAAAGGATNASCTFHNARNSGKLELRKVTDPTTDTGTFNLYAKQSGVTKLSAVAVGNGGTSGSGGTSLPTGAYDLSEEGAGTTSLDDYTPSLACKNRSDNSSVTVTNGSVTLATNADVICTFTNARKPKLTVTKKIVGGNGTTDSFDVKVDGTTKIDNAVSTAAAGTSEGPFAVTAAAHTVSETLGDGSTAVPSADWTIAFSGDCDSSGSVTLAAGQSKSCTITNTKKGRAKVTKTVSGSAPSGTQSFTFTLRQGADTTHDGTILGTLYATVSNGGILNFGTGLVPGNHYQLCEDVMPGWSTSLGPSLFVPGSMLTPTLPNPNVNNMTVCTDFIAQAGQTTSFSVDNTPPPGGRALTIGFWKNWASCTNSSLKKTNSLDQALATATAATSNPPAGLVVSAQNSGLLGWPNFAATYYLILKGDSSKPNAAPDCSKAVNLLNKSTVTGAKKMSSDPLFNMTAQLIGAQLNYFAGAGGNAPTTNNIVSGVLLDGKYQFNGDGYAGKLSSADATKANCLAIQLDNYNNDRSSVTTCP